MKKTVTAVMAVSGLMILLAAAGCFSGGIGSAAQAQPEILSAMPEMAARFSKLGSFYTAMSAAAAVVAVVIALKLTRPLRCIGIACAEAMGFLAVLALVVVTQGSWVKLLFPEFPETADLQAFQASVLQKGSISFLLTLGILAVIIVLMNGILRRNSPEGVRQ